jgi:hypothetical protein
MTPTRAPNKFVGFAKTWLLAVMLLSFSIFIYGRISHFNALEYGTIAAAASMIYVSLVFEEIIEKKPLFKIVTDIGDD